MENRGVALPRQQGPALGQKRSQGVQGITLGTGLAASVFERRSVLASNRLRDSNLDFSLWIYSVAFFIFGIWSKSKQSSKISFVSIMGASQRKRAESTLLFNTQLKGVITFLKTLGRSEGNELRRNLNSNRRFHFPCR